MIFEYDASEDKCPLPLVKMRVLLNKMKDNDVCIIKVADSGSKSDIPKYLTDKGYVFCQRQISTTLVELHIKTGKLL